MRSIASIDIRSTAIDECASAGMRLLKIEWAGPSEVDRVEIGAQ